MPNTLSIGSSPSGCMIECSPPHLGVEILKILVTQLQLFNPITTVIESLKDRQSQIQ